MKTYILKSWVDGKVVYKSDNLFHLKVNCGLMLQ